MAGVGRVAIIGAGMAGLACARALADAGWPAVVIDKGRGIGGRIATRRGAVGVFDHGAVALSVADGACEHAPYTSAYLAYLATATELGAATAWPAARGWVGLPGMSGIVQPMARGLDVRVATEVTGLEQGKPGWQLQGAGVPEDPFEQVVLAIPQPQALTLLASWPSVQAAIAGARMTAVWTAMVLFDETLPLTSDLVSCDEGPISVAIRTSAKPGRAGSDKAASGEAWVLHAAADWTAAHLEWDKPAAAAQLLAAFFDQSGLTPVVPVWLEGHRWRHGLTGQPLGQAFVRDAGIGLSVCGDWCLGRSARDAYASGSALAAALLGQ